MTKAAQKELFNRRILRYLHQDGYEQALKHKDRMMNFRYSHVAFKFDVHYNKVKMLYDYRYPWSWHLPTVIGVK